MSHAIAFSISKRRPGCVLIQAALGGTVPSETFHKLFPSETWLVGMGDDMQLYAADDEDLQAMSVMAADATAEE